MNTQRKMKKLPKESNVAFVTRLIDYAEEPLTLRMAIDRVHKRTWKPTEVQMRNALSNAVKTGAILQKRDVHYKRVVYYSDVTPLQAAHIYENVTPEDERKEEVRAIVHDAIDKPCLMNESVCVWEQYVGDVFDGGFTCMTCGEWRQTQEELHESFVVMPTQEEIDAIKAKCERPLQLESDAIVASKRPTITGLVTVTMDADAFVENLHRLDAQLYQRVLNAIGDSIGVGGSWSRDGNGNMIYEVSI